MCLYILIHQVHQSLQKYKKVIVFYKKCFNLDNDSIRIAFAYCLWLIASRRGASDSVTDSSVLSNPVDAQNVSCLGLCGRNICPKSSA